VPRKIHSADLETRSGRLRLAIRGKPYFLKLMRGVALGYRRNKTDGVWIVRVTTDGTDWLKSVGPADDFQDAGGDVLTFDRAQEKAREIARTAVSPDKAAGRTVAAALDRYEEDLKVRGGDTGNVSRARGHLSKILRKDIGELEAQELKDWRNALVKKMTPASANRTATVLRAALNAAADHDRTIGNRQAWKIGLAAIPDAGKARNVILNDAQVFAIVQAAYLNSPQFGEFVEVLAVTGARPSQAARLSGTDVQAGRSRLMMPSSKKGRGTKRVTQRAISIPVELAKRLMGRNGLLLRHPADLGPWGKSAHQRRFAAAVQAADVTPALDPKEVTVYALRHSSIVRMLIANVPIRVVAAHHDTSVAMIERNYSEYITDYADDLTRSSLLDTSSAAPRPSASARIADTHAKSLSPQTTQRTRVRQNEKSA
jgi:integrase